MPQLILQGRVYIAKTPLFEITMKNGELKYAFNDKEKDKIVEEFGVEILKIQRNKGLGETDAETLSKTTMNPNTRVIERVVVEDVEKMGKYFMKWMGDNVDMRKQHIEKYLHEFSKDLD